MHEISELEGDKDTKFCCTLAVENVIHLALITTLPVGEYVAVKSSDHEL